MSADTRTPMRRGGRLRIGPLLVPVCAAAVTAGIWAASVTARPSTGPSGPEYCRALDSLSSAPVSLVKPTSVAAAEKAAASFASASTYVLAVAPVSIKPALEKLIAAYRSELSDLKAVGYVAAKVPMSEHQAFDTTMSKLTSEEVALSVYSVRACRGVS